VIVFGMAAFLLLI